MLCTRENVLVTKKKEKKYYSSVILDVDDSEVVISYPKLNGERLEVSNDEILEITFSNEGIRYRFESGFSRKVGDVLVIKQPRLMEKTELRRYPRVPVNTNVFFTEISCNDYVGADLRQGQLMDISGNGIRLAVDQLYIPGTYLSVNFDLPVREQFKPVNMECRVVRIIVDDQKDPVEYQLGAEFSRIDERDQEHIINFVCKEISYKATIRTDVE